MPGARSPWSGVGTLRAILVQHMDSHMTTLWELRRIVYRATDPKDDDIEQMLGCYPTMDEAELALDEYSNRYPYSSLYIA